MGRTEKGHQNRFNLQGTVVMNETIQAGAFFVKEAVRLIRGFRARSTHADVELDLNTATFLVQPAAWKAIAMYAEQRLGSAKKIHGTSRVLFGVPVTIIGSDPDAPSIRLVMEAAILPKRRDD